MTFLNCKFFLDFNCCWFYPLKKVSTKPGGLDLSWSCLDRESWSWHCQRVSLNSWENLDIFKKCVSTIEKSRLRSMSRPKSLDQDREIHQDLKILAFLDSSSRSRSRSGWILAFSSQDFSIRQDFSSFSVTWSG